MREFLTAYFENIHQAAERNDLEPFEIIEIDCRFCPFRAECHKASEECEDEIDCVEFLKKMMESR